MKHGERETLERVLGWVGRNSDEAAVSRCSRFAELLVSEGIAAGALGPNEGPRVWRRHILDAVCFAGVGRGPDWLDVGSGAGLPGLPIACCYPDLEVTLLDRSGRRIDLLRRWTRVLGLENVSIVEGDVDRYHRRHGTISFRGSLTLEAAVAATRRLAVCEGVFGLSHTGAAQPDPMPAGVEAITVPDEVLDTGVTLLRITP